MRGRITLVLLVVLGIMPFQSNAGAPQDLIGVGPVFGGAHVKTNISGEQVLNLQDLPPIVEDYTATWCSNCIDVEHALYNIQNETMLQIYMMHRFIGEQQDPFGTQESDDRWKERYASRLPPIVVFNGTVKQTGSTPHGDSLEDDFTTLVKRTLDVGQGTTSLTWVNETNTASWNVVGIDDFENGKLESMIWVVEKMGFFEEGGNKEEYYPDIVRKIIYLGNATSGSKVIDLPAAWDDDDLEIHLIHQINMTSMENTPDENIPDDKESKFLPGFSFAGIITAMVVVSIVKRRKLK